MDDADDSDERAEIERLKLFEAAGWTAETEREEFNAIARPDFAGHVRRPHRKVLAEVAAARFAKLPLSALVAHNPRVQRAVVGLSQRDLAKLSGISKNRISLIENGEDCRLSTLDALARHLRTTPAKLLTVKTSDSEPPKIKRLVEAAERISNKPEWTAATEREVFASMAGPAPPDHLPTRHVLGHEWYGATVRDEKKPGDSRLEIARRREAALGRARRRQIRALAARNLGDTLT